VGMAKEMGVSVKNFIGRNTLSNVDIKIYSIRNKTFKIMREDLLCRYLFFIKKAGNFIIYLCDTFFEIFSAVM